MKFFWQKNKIIKDLPPEERKILLYIIRKYLAVTDIGCLLVKKMGLEGAEEMIVRCLEDGVAQIYSDGEEKYWIKPTPKGIKEGKKAIKELGFGDY